MTDCKVLEPDFQAYLPYVMHGKVSVYMRLRALVFVWPTCCTCRAYAMSLLFVAWSSVRFVPPGACPSVFGSFSSLLRVVCDSVTRDGGRSHAEFFGAPIRPSVALASVPSRGGRSYSKKPFLTLYPFCVPTHAGGTSASGILAKRRSYGKSCDASLSFSCRRLFMAHRRRGRKNERSHVKFVGASLRFLVSSIQWRLCVRYVEGG